MLTALFAAAAFLVGVIVGGIGGFYFVDATAFAPRKDPGSFAEQEDFWGTRRRTEGACVDLATALAKLATRDYGYVNN
jgi:hypothetical protein